MHAQTTTQLRSVSYGGGVQSTALLVLAAQGHIDFPLFVFANVGQDSERSATLRYVEEYAKPYAAQHGIELAEVQRIRRDGTTETLYGRLTRPESRSIPIPVRMSNGAPGTRSCTADFKIRQVGKEMKRRGASAGRVCIAHRADPTSPRCKGHRCIEQNKAVIGIGISLDEIQRANTRRVEPHEEIVYPLLELGLRRIDCERVIRAAGLPVPPKSSCYFCPFHRPEAWHDMRRKEPEEFEKACQLEELLNERRDALGKDHVFLTAFNRPLRQAIPDGVDLLPMFDEADGLCDSGWCMT